MRFIKNLSFKLILMFLIGASPLLFSACNNPDSDPITYTITWVNYDGTVLKTHTNVEYGATPIYDGEIPEKFSTQQYDYIFTGWSPVINSVTDNITYTAQFSEQIRTYTVNFYDGLGELIKSVQVEYGKDAIAPTEEERYIPGYKLLKWDRSFINIQSDLNVYGVYINDTVTDTDEDGIIDFIEIKILNLNYLSKDSDNDGTLDCDEDFDNDGLTNIEEIKEYFTKPEDADSDNDGCNDGDEVLSNLDPNDPDTDGDGLTDGEEFDHFTIPDNPDTDGDGVYDGEEIANGTDPCDENSY